MLIKEFLFKKNQEKMFIFYYFLEIYVILPYFTYLKRTLLPGPFECSLSKFNRIIANYYYKSIIL
ncbi:hypothetical protein BpHYR1_012939 [Brachionus plicatilis]|uniref:Uncharacterized protein n=1 Tax=Brachionus plicatilis TaxID=10195 RepID=A0A3M7SNW8_BRAPC|nr:hypothetical protein BpHYR1_012939 [Brachionus plicatilis]